MVGVVDDDVTVHMVHIHRESFLAGQYWSIYIHDNITGRVFTHTQRCIYTPLAYTYISRTKWSASSQACVCVCVVCVCMCVLVYV